MLSGAQHLFLARVLVAKGIPRCAGNDNRWMGRVCFEFFFSGCLASHDHGSGNHVVQSLLALGEGGHNVADEQRKPGNPFGKMASGGVHEGQALACVGGDSNPKRHLAQRGLSFRADEVGFIEPARDNRDQQAQADQGIESGSVAHETYRDMQDQANRQHNRKKNQAIDEYGEETDPETRVSRGGTEGLRGGRANAGNERTAAAGAESCTGGALLAALIAENWRVGHMGGNYS